MRTRAVAAALGLGLVAACGLKSSPVAPQLVQPTPPASVHAASVRAGVRLSWRRPVRYTGGGRMRDLEGFEIDRAPTPSGPFARVERIDLTDQQRFRPQRDLEWTDPNVIVGEQYVYRVISVTVDGDRSAPSPLVTIRHDPRATAAERTPRDVP
jgi:hypothetical protein